MTTVRELFTRLGFKTDTASLNQAEQGINRVKDAAESAAESLRKAALAFVSFSTIQGLVRVADEMQSIRARIEALPQTVGDAGVAFDTLADRAASAGVSIDAYASLYTKVGNAAKDYISTQEDLLGITDTISKALVVGGASAQEASAVMTQFSQALASGVLQGDEFRSMAEAAPQYLEQLSIAMNIPRENLKKMASDGKLTARAVIEATRQMSGYFEDRFKRMPMTVGRAINIIQVRFSKMIDKMNRDTNLIPTIADKMVKAFDKIEEGIGFLIDKLGGFENAVRLAGAAIVVAFGAKTLQVLAAFRLASLAALWPYIRMIAVLTAVTLLLEDLYVWIQGGDSVTGQFLGTWENLKATFMTVWPIIKNIGGAVMLLGTALGVAKVASILINGAMIALNITMGIFNMLLNMSPLGKIIMLVGLLAAAGIALYKNWDTVKAWFASFFGWMGSKFEWLLDKIRGLGAIAGLIPGLNVVAGGLAAYDAMKASPSKMASSALGGGGVTSNTTVNMTVPPGTTKEQQAAVKRTAEMAFGKPNTSLARDISARGR